MPLSSNTNETITEDLESGSVMGLWSGRLIIILGVTIIIAIPLTLTTVIGAFASLRKRPATVIDCVIIFYSLALVQVCFVAETSTFARVLAWHTDFVDIFAACFVIHFSIYMGSVILEAGLTVVTIFRYIFIFHPHLGVSIAARPRQTLAFRLSFLTVLAIARGAGDYMFEQNALFHFCVGASHISYNNFVFTANTMVYTTYLAIIYLLDFFLSVKIWKYIQSKKRRVGLLNPATVSRRQQQNLITAGGSAISRMITILPYIGIGVLQAFLKPQDEQISDILYCLIIYIMYFICVTILLPLSCILHSPLIREPIIKACSKVSWSNWSAWNTKASPENSTESESNHGKVADVSSAGIYIGE